MLFTDLNDRQLFADKKFQKMYNSRLRELVEQHKMILLLVFCFLRNKLLKIFPKPSLLNVCIENFSHSQDLSRALNVPMLGQFLTSGILMCLAAYQITAVIFRNLNSYLLIFLLNICSFILIYLTFLQALDKSMIRTVMNLFYLIYNMFMYYLLCNWCDEIKIQVSFRILSRHACWRPTVFLTILVL